jgi:hypothetical protein
MLDGRDRSTDWWQKAVVVPVRRAWVIVAARLRRKKHGGKFDCYLTAGQFVVHIFSLIKHGCACPDHFVYHWT